ncbi:hypothetical protein BK133_02830 [Paenibacillus sp. FSL H8-0548]|uniref:hypothetical protein n=1 Tax=Paenibacillus sp. FSL H8-0548 TaxID=1920422 RepID=UPI00096EB92E|nr:hypothetical protein [Paenibacillus sp. FSL H8-0548]OMF37938.1 hypothetical protein BK133_02830 [Paenibacillus sp. FSL H8-0548]
MLEGLNKLEYSLSSGKVEAFNEIGRMFDNYEEWINFGKREEEYFEAISEVKAGSFVYTPAITDYVAHVKSLKALIEKADYQCETCRQRQHYLNRRFEHPTMD